MLKQIALIAVGTLFLGAELSAQSVDPRTNCWLTTYSGKYARIWTNDTMMAEGNTLTNWSNGQNTQSSPAYCGVQEVYSSTNWVYVRSTGLASYIMGPWMNGNFPNLPVNQKVLFRFPRTNSVPTTKTANGGGQIGVFVDGVAMYNSWDAFTWDAASNADEQNVSGYWNRDAYVNEGASFDAGYAHQQNTGQYHYHADPIALRYLLGDHVDYNATTKTYSEDTNTPTKHSPILGWAADGYPIYGPYGYSSAMDTNSGIRRMVSGYVLRNGQDGSDDQTNLSPRATIPQWAVRLFNVSSNQVGPPFTGIHTNGCYMEDNDYLGDVIDSGTGTNYQQGVDFDLDQYNGRYCDTPDFPNGTYAYFVAINSNGVPVFPYNIGFGYYGTPAGGTVVAIAEPVVTNFLGNTNLSSSLSLPVLKPGAVTLTWSSLEGGSYEVLSTTNLTSSWTTVSTGNKSAPNQITASYTNTTSSPNNFYQVARTSVATYDTAGTTIFATNIVVSSGAPGAASPGQYVLLTVNLPSSPPNPPAGAPITSVTIGDITATSVSDSTQGQVQALFQIPSGASTGSQTITVTFDPMPTYTLNGYFSIN
jgi:YHYH protein